MSARRNASAWRGISAVGGSLLLVGRRARRDLGPLLGVVALTAIMAGIAVAAPSEIDTTRDRAAREAIVSAGPEADLLLRSAIADRAAANTTTAERLLAFASEVPERLPRELADAVSEVRTGILGPELHAAGPLGDLRLHVGVLDPAAKTELILDAGRLPNGGASELEIVISAATAEVTGLGVGEQIDARGGVGSDGLVAQIVGIARALDPGSRAWRDLPGVWEPRELTSRGTPVGVTFTALGDAAAFDRVSSEFPGASVGIIRTAFDPALFSMKRLDEVQAAIDDIETATHTITQGAPLSLSATSGIEKALKSFTAAVTAATAQLSALAAGLLGVAVLITVLAGTALARRRQREIELLRSRGASLGLIGAHAAIESTLVTLAGSALGVAVAALLGYSLDSVTLLAIAAALVAVTPVAVTIAWAREATPSTTRARAVRIAGVTILVVVAVMAIVAQRSGVSVGGAGIDPLALAAPILCAAVVALALSPLSGAAVRPISRTASRTRGAGTLLAASSARDGRSVVTLFTLTLAVSVAITSLVLLSTVATGQQSTSWRFVGADVRVDNAADAVALSQTFASDGAVAAPFAELGGVKVEGGGDSSIATVLAVGGDYAQLVAALPAGLAQHGDADAVRQLVAAGGDAGGPVPVLFNARLAAAVDAETISIDIDGTPVEVTVVGAPIAGPAGSGSALIVDRERLIAHLLTLKPAVGEETLATLAPTSVLAVGESAATRSATVADGDGDVTVRADVLAQLRDGALVAGVRAATLQSLLGTGALTLLALIVTTVLGARRRGRSLALLGALGVPKRASFAIASGELVPLVVSGIIGGGIAAAVAITAAGSAFGVETLAGGPAPFIVSPWLVAAVIGAAAAALALAIAVDTPLSRRVGTTEILRTGEES